MLHTIVNNVHSAAGFFKGMPAAASSRFWSLRCCCQGSLHRSNAVFLAAALGHNPRLAAVEFLSLLGQPHTSVLSEVYDILSKLRKALHTSRCMTTGLLH